MPLTNSVIRRYTPPTCTLEVLAQSSSLSRWVGKSVLKDLRFELSIDDPRLSEEQKIVIRGDRDQLEALCAAVTNYVQEFLQISPETFWANFSDLENSTKTSDPDQLESQEQLQPSVSTQTLNSFNNQLPETEIHIKPNSRLTHNLFLGSLGYQASQPVVQLNLLQLFDLATALDQYSDDLLALPSLYQNRSRFAIPGWVPAVAVLVLAIGLVPFTYQYAIQTKQKPSTTKEKLALEPSPPSDLATPLPALTPTDQLPALPFGSNNLSVPGSGTLPPNQTSPQTQGFPNAPLIANAPSQGGSPSASTTSPTATFVPPSPGKNVFTAPLTSTNSQRQVLIQPKPSQNNSTAVTQKNGVVAQNGEISLNSPTTPTSLPSNLPSTLPSTLPTVPPPIATAPNSRGSTQQSQSSTTTSSIEAEDTSKLIERLRQDRNSNKVATGNSNAVLDATTQLSEAKQFLTKRWQPPSGLNQTLEYSLMVGVDGTIERILPLGKASRIYIDRTGMPLIGERFISPNRNGQSVIIRAVYSPDGKVQTFAEKD
ncbi:MAG: DUF4335 domain-containing protein [Pelatocladus maniniholoensis HA4357-MV3]|jgi:hypothetical protein|uniref:DUF4335 domain-containing protein n=1 Tax=Pelatocladus maniniholoensis HA4357-MV3 TaxID=1117104 RepID=A0A9E3H598_9NOST|nr:DUF4335 domain-containing protein [Pelatocladus maniniholoensis HA4357-MV3]